MAVVEWLVSELYGVAVPGETARPMTLGFTSDEVARIISIGDAGRSDPTAFNLNG